MSPVEWWALFDGHQERAKASQPDNKQKLSPEHVQRLHSMYVKAKREELRQSQHGTEENGP